MICYKYFIILFISAFAAVNSSFPGPTHCRDGSREGTCVSPTGCRPNINSPARPSRQGTCPSGMECCIRDPTCLWSGGSCTTAQACQNGPNGLAFPNWDPMDCRRNGMVCCVRSSPPSNPNYGRYQRQQYFY